MYMFSESAPQLLFSFTAKGMKKAIADTILVKLSDSVTRHEKSWESYWKIKPMLWLVVLYWLYYTVSYFFRFHCPLFINPSSYVCCVLCLVLPLCPHLVSPSDSSWFALSFLLFFHSFYLFSILFSVSPISFIFFCSYFFFYSVKNVGSERDLSFVLLRYCFFTLSPFAHFWTLISCNQNKLKLDLLASTTTTYKPNKGPIFLFLEK